MNRKLKKNVKAFTNLVPMVLAVVIVFAILFVGIFVNGEIYQALDDSFPTAPKGTSGAIQNTSMNRMDNVSVNQDSALDIVQVVIIITVLAGAIAAIFLFTRFR